MATRDKLRALKTSKGQADTGSQHLYEETPTEHLRARLCPGAAQERGHVPLSPFRPRRTFPDLSKLLSPSLPVCSLLGECFCTLTLPLPEDFFFGSGSRIFPARQLLCGGTELPAALH